MVPLRLTLGGKTFAVFHGHETAARDVMRMRSIDYICHGHTHATRDERVDGKRIINPGALHRVKTRTVAILDTGSDQLEFHEIKASG
jgi:predicted phosphodiesterase